jgi:ABC-type antimicrobial peptide transport system permease subunit
LLEAPQLEAAMVVTAPDPATTKVIAAGAVDAVKVYGAGDNAVLALRSQGFSTFSVPLPTMAAVLVLAIACGVLAAARPARHAARLDVLNAIATQ